MTWRDKANRLISEMCMESYVKANTTKAGKRRKKYVSYTVPEEAEFLVKCLSTNDEESAKYYFVYGIMPT